MHSERVGRLHRRGPGACYRHKARLCHAHRFGGLAAIIAEARLPTYAIGGIVAGDAAAVRAAGAAGLAVVSAVVRAADPQAATAALVAEWGAA
jgi:thiamine monophosphate synthase